MSASVSRSLIRLAILVAASMNFSGAQAQEGLVPDGTTTLVQAGTFDIGALRDFSLIIDQAHRTEVIAGADLTKSYGSAWFVRAADGLHIASMSRHPDPWRHTKPATMLRLHAPIFLALQPLHVDALFTVGPTPAAVMLDIVRLKGRKLRAPLTLFVTGDTVNARVCRNKATACYTVVAGTLSARRSAHIELDARPGNMLELTVNGTHSHVPLARAVTHQKLSFEAGIGSDKDVYALPSPERATISRLSIKLGAKALR